MLPADSIPRRRAGLGLLARLPASPSVLLPRLAPPVTLLAAGISLGHFSRTAGAETLLLTLLAAGVLAAAAVLAPRPAVEVAAGAGLAALVLWVLPEGPTRGVGVVLVAAGMLTVAATRRLRRGGEITYAAGAALVVGLGLLLRSDLLLPAGLGARTAVDLLAFPALAGAALALLARRHGAGRALVAGAVVLPLTPGCGIATTLAILALAAGEWLRRPAAGAEGLAAGKGSFLRMSLLRRRAAALVIVAPLVWDLRGGAMIAAAALALALAGGARERRWWPLVPALAALAGAALFPARPWAEAVALAAWLPLLLPVLAAAGRDRLPLAAAAAVLVLAAGLGVPAEAGPVAVLAAPLLLAALALPGAGGGRLAASAATLQGGWSATLLAAAGLAAAYPWLRDEPLEVALGLFGLAPRWSIVPVWLAAAGALVLVVAAGRPRWHRAAAVTGTALAAAFLFHLPPAPVAADQPGGTVVLGPRRPAWHLELPGEAAGEVVLDTSLAFAARLPAGTPVATLRVEDHRGRRIEHTLRAGVETGEWAARRADVAGRPGFAAPPPWLSQVADGGDFFGQRYRCHLGIGPPPEDARPDPSRWVKLTLLRRADLPREVTLAVFHAEVRP